MEALGAGSYDWAQCVPPTGEQLRRMWAASPAAHVPAMVAPTMIALGMADRRVPPSQGLELFHSLRAKGVPVRLLQYPTDTHAIGQPASEADFWLNAKAWFDEHLY